MDPAQGRCQSSASVPHAQLATHPRDPLIRSYTVTNLEVKDSTRLEDIEPRVTLALFGHVARMQLGIPAHDALWTAIGARCGSAPGPGWKHPRGRPRTTWAEQLSRDLDGMGLWEAWYLAMDRESGGSSRRAFAAQA